MFIEYQVEELDRKYLEDFNMLQKAFYPSAKTIYHSLCNWQLSHLQAV